MRRAGEGLRGRRRSAVGPAAADKVAAIEFLAVSTARSRLVGAASTTRPPLRPRMSVSSGAMGSDAALETADVALMTDELSKVPYTIRLSRATVRNIRTNVAISIALKGAFMILAVSGVATLWMAVLADTGASALVVANAVRLRRFT